MFAYNYSDTPQKDWDKQISTFLLNSKVQKGRGRTKNTFPTKNRDGSANDTIDWTLSTLRTYVLLVRDRLHPRLSEPARCLLVSTVSSSFCTVFCYLLLIVVMSFRCVTTSCCDRKRRTQPFFLRVVQVALPYAHWRAPCAWLRLTQSLCSIVLLRLRCVDLKNNSNCQFV